MRITIDGAGKRYNFEWILQNINLTLASSQAYAVLGPNGSGKSTFLQLIAGNIAPSAGTVLFLDGEKPVEAEKVFSRISMAAPYLELIEEFTALEMIHFHQTFKPFISGISNTEIMTIARLEKEANKEVRNFSSGMKQRLKLTLAILSNVPVILLDEPTTNLDREGVQWYQNLVKQYAGARLLIIGSNLEREYDFCDQLIDVMSFKSSSS